MGSRIYYEICPACGFANLEKKGACLSCDNRLFSDGKEEHERYVKLIESECMRKTLQWYGGWAVVVLIFFGPFLMLALGRRVTWVPGATALVGAMVLGWRLIDLKKKRHASAKFLIKHGNNERP